MTDAAGHFAQRILARQALVGVAAFIAIALLSPQVLLVEWDVGLGMISVGIRIAACSLAATAAISLVGLRKHRFVLRSLALGSRAIEPEELEALAQIPSKLTIRFFVLSSLFASLMLVPGIRPDKLDDGRAVSLF